MRFAKAPYCSYKSSFSPLAVANSIDFFRYQIMLKCWEENASDRTIFANLKDTMKEMERNHKVSSAESTLCNLSFMLSNANLIMFDFHFSLF